MQIKTMVFSVTDFIVIDFSVTDFIVIDFSVIDFEPQVHNSELH